MLTSSLSTSHAALESSASTAAIVGEASRRAAPSRTPIARRVRHRVLHVINGEHYSGAERVQDLLAERLPERGFDVGFACLKPGRFGAVRRCRSAPLYDISMRGKFDFRAAGRLARVVARESYNLLHAHTPRALLVARLAATWTKTPLVYHVHSPALRDSTRWLPNRLNAAAERICLTGNAPLIAVSQSIGQDLTRSGFAKSRINVVANGVPQGHVQRLATPPQGVWTLGIAALFRPRKGAEVLLEAMALLRRRGRDVRLRAVGPFETADYEQSLKGRAKDLDLQSSIDWTGFVRDVPAELATMDLFVLPSLFGEGLPMVALEAMAAGLPVVATCVEGIPEAVRDGLDGILAEPNDPSDLARQIDLILSGELDWTFLRENSLSRHRECFSDESMAANVAEVYERILIG